MKRKANSISLQHISIFTDIQNNIPMKRFQSILAILLLAGGLMASCSTQKKACAAYSSIETHQPAENC